MWRILMAFQMFLTLSLVANVMARDGHEASNDNTLDVDVKGMGDISVNMGDRTDNQNIVLLLLNHKDPCNDCDNDDKPPPKVPVPEVTTPKVPVPTKVPVPEVTTPSSSCNSDLKLVPSLNLTTFGAWYIHKATPNSFVPTGATCGVVALDTPAPNVVLYWHFYTAANSSFYQECGHISQPEDSRPALLSLSPGIDYSTRSEEEDQVKTWWVMGFAQGQYASIYYCGGDGGEWGLIMTSTPSPDRETLDSAMRSFSDRGLTSLEWFDVVQGDRCGSYSVPPPARSCLIRS